jgi:hypothetical protein
MLCVFLIYLDSADLVSLLDEFLFSNAHAWRQIKSPSDDSSVLYRARRLPVIANIKRLQYDYKQTHRCERVY